MEMKAKHVFQPITISTTMFILILFIIISSSIVAGSVKGIIIVYGRETCPACSSLEKFFEYNSIPFEFRSIDNKKYFNEAFSIYKLAKLGGYIPISVVINYDGDIVAIVEGVVGDTGFWHELLSKNFNGSITVFKIGAGGKHVTELINNASTINNIKSVVLGHEIPSETTSTNINNAEPSYILGKLIGLALVDSVNPCAISTAAFISLSAISMGLTSKRRYLISTLFIGGVYTGYLLTGIAVNLALLSKYLLPVVIAIAIFIIAKDLYGLRKGKEAISFSCKEGSRNPVPKFVMNVEKYKNPLIAFGAGIVISLTFMMCSAAPYFIFLSILSIEVKDLVLRALYVILYCIIIIIPIALAAFCATKIASKISSLEKILFIRSILLGIVVVYSIYLLIEIFT